MQKYHLILGVVAAALCASQAMASAIVDSIVQHNNMTIQPPPPPPPPPSAYVVPGLGEVDKIAASETLKRKKEKHVAATPTEAHGDSSRN